MTELSPYGAGPTGTLVYLVEDRDKGFDTRTAKKTFAGERAAAVGRHGLQLQSLLRTLLRL